MDPQSAKEQTLSYDGRIGERLVAKGVLRADALEKALLAQEQLPVRLGSILLRMGSVSESALLSELSEQLNLPVLPDSFEIQIDDVMSCLGANGLSLDWALDQGVLIWRESGELKAIARDCLDVFLKEVLSTSCQAETIQFYLCGNEYLERYLSRLEQGYMQSEKIGALNDANSLKELAEQAPVVEFVNNLFSKAMEASASDIHVEPYEHFMIVRLRIDGVLHEISRQSIDRYSAISSRIKLISGLDIAERRLPQDGRVSVRAAGKEIDIRLSTAPGVYGESLVMRLLPKEREELSLAKLGLEPDHLDVFRRVLRHPNGVILVTGPTGSGKSTSLYSALHELADGSQKIITVEDPVEFMVPGVTQIHAQSQIGYDFARALRAVLRQDPDVIMVGEIRDGETADIAIRSALTGHLVLSTLHTNDALSAITRLIDMGVEPYLVAAPLNLLQAQRLLRRLCPNCAKMAEPPANVLSEYKQVIERSNLMESQVWKEPVGCKVCAQTGYKGRLGVYEMLEISDGIRDLIARNAPMIEIRDSAKNEGMRTLWEDALIKCARGESTWQEAVRVCKN